MNIAAWNRMLTMTGRLFDRRHSTVPFVQPTASKPVFSGVTTAPLPRATPESQGLSSRQIAAFFRALQADDTLDMHSVTVIRGGKVLAQATFGDWDTGVWRATFSACKSVTALAVGLLVDEGLLQLSDRVTDYFDEQLTPLAKLKWRELTVEDLLTMRSGATFNEMGSVSEEDWVKSFFAASISGTIGVDFRYNSLNTYLLSAIVQKITGLGLCDYLRPRLFDPLGVGEVYWETCPAGIEKGGWGLFIQPEDLAKLGLLVMQRGAWQGKQLISEAWIDAATAPHAKAPAAYGDYDYGYQIWTGRSQNRFLFNGMLGQNVMGFWDNGVLLVSHAGNNEMFQQSRYFTLAHRAFGGEFPAALPEDAAARRELEQTCRALRAAYPTPPKATLWQCLMGKSPHLLPEPCYRWDQATYTVAQLPEAASVGLLPVSLQAVTNRYATGLQGLRLAVENETEFVLYYREADGEHRVPVGFFAPVRTTLQFGGDAYLVAASGRFSTDEEDRPVLLLRLCFLETPYTRRLKLTFCGNTLRLTQSESPGEEFLWLLVDDTRSDMEKQPLVGGALQKLDLDYFHYKTERLFVPRVELQRADA